MAVQGGVHPLIDVRLESVGASRADRNHLTRGLLSGPGMDFLTK